ncbi:MAG: ABC transporter ATP-binding protein [Methanomicrobiaceae archaeon]|nr:ABC transporter ATP-binding protein [Methanomicrobiaceae archaeon]
MNVIETSSLGKAFGGRVVLDGVSFGVKKGEVFGFLGPNGAGKTTTLRLLLGLLEPGEGEALVFGDRLADREDLRRCVGVLLESNGLFDQLSARENLDYYGRLYGVPDLAQRISDILALTGLEERADSAVGTFSTGMKRKLGLGRSLLHEPEILFLDEPSSGLDPEAQRMVRELITEVSRHESVTVFLNSHNLDEVQRVCDTVAILDRGRIRAYDRVAALQENRGGVHFALTLADAGDASRAEGILAAMEEVRDYRIEDGVITTVLPEGAAPAEVLARMVREGILIEEARKTRRSLEEIYLDAVGPAKGAA